MEDRLAVGDHDAIAGAKAEAPGCSNALRGRDRFSCAEPARLPSPLPCDLAADAEAHDPGLRIGRVAARSVHKDQGGPPGRLEPHGLNELCPPPLHGGMLHGSAQPALAALQGAALDHAAPAAAEPLTLVAGAPPPYMLD